MKLALVGYGKMGRAVENMAMEKGHEVVAKIDPTLGSHAINAETLGGADVAIEFTAPDVAVENITALAAAGVDAVVALEPPARREGLATVGPAARVGLRAARRAAARRPIGGVQRAADRPERAGGRRAAELRPWHGDSERRALLLGGRRAAVVVGVARREEVADVLERDEHFLTS